MEPLYAESRPIMPRNLTYVAALVLIATAVFMTLSEPLTGAAVPSWTIAVTWVLFIIVIAVLLILRMDVTVTSEGVEIRYAFRSVTIPMGEIIDSRHGDMTAIRSYGNWNLKGVKHRTYSRIGDEEGVALKLLGKRVVVLSTSEPETVGALMPKDVPKEDEKEDNTEAE